MPKAICSKEEAKTTTLLAADTSSLADDFKCESCFYQRHQNNTTACKTCDGSSNFREYISPKKQEAL
jgi:hypothetical protein